MKKLQRGGSKEGDWVYTESNLGPKKEVLGENCPSEEANKMSAASEAHARANALTVKSFVRPDETRSFEKGRLDVITIGGVTFGRGTFEPGWKWSACVKPVAKTESCQAAHLGYQVSGRLHVVMDDGTEKEIGPGEICSIPPGHDAWVVGNERVVMLDITGAGDYAKPK